MIVILNICQRERDQALRLLEYIGILGGVAKHDIVLQFSQGMKRDGHTENLEDEARKHFASVSTIVPSNEDERGWPWSANHAWMHALQTVREKIQKPWFWMEPDCLPLKPEWLDKIEAEYERAKKPFMGAEVRSPAHRMSGIGVYPPRVVSYLRRRVLGDLQKAEAFDSFFAPEIVEHAHFTPLIQNVWSVKKGEDVPPTFPDAESLGMIDPRSVLFHRCKDGTLLDRLTEQRSPLKPIVSSGEWDSNVSHKHVSVSSTLTPATTFKRVPRGTKKKRKKRKPMSEENKKAAIARLALAREAKKKKALA